MILIGILQPQMMELTKKIQKKKKINLWTLNYMKKNKKKNKKRKMMIFSLVVQIIIIMGGDLPVIIMDLLKMKKHKKNFNEMKSKNTNAISSAALFGS